MVLRFEDICCKEVINICDGRRMGFADDMEIETVSGCVISIIIPGPARWFGLRPCEKKFIIPWDCIIKIGDDIILIDYDEHKHKPKPPPKLT